MTDKLAAFALLQATNKQQRVVNSLLSLTLRRT